MKPGSPSGGRDNRAAPQPSARDIPNSDMEDEDVGTTDSSSAHEHEEDSGTTASRAMKQTGKTTAESGEKKR